MGKQKKDKHTNIPKAIEKHETAAWADIQKVKPVSNVAIPSETAVRDAKDWVDANQK
ncbi:protein of unknown function [Caldanaerobius fijiensis DSM 17918]|uniref:DUF3787 domain-containing protein n=1 Tax=Caldanaerobius fijiensis DSM 17918 TaxID=1121256 RepID=A0A1M5E437_9THEO|nr:DUF3787 domain-containing protein [Caldanaerobius fijiensis]SHF73966.1 protein of unknown function [Caldanaerobius fijiensis DSM 17918]